MYDTLEFDDIEKIRHKYQKRIKYPKILRIDYPNFLLITEPFVYYPTLHENPCLQS